MDVIFFFQSTSRSSWRAKLAGAYRFAREHDWFIHVVEPSTSAADIRRFFREWHPVGCLVDRALGIGNAPNRLFDAVPTVFLDDITSVGRRSHPCLLHDSATEASLAGGELLKLKCRSYAYFGTGRGFFWDNERRDRFRHDAHAAGNSVCELSRAGLRTALKKLPKPCGILAANDLCALEVFHAAIATGFSIPGDIAIAGIDNDEMLCESVSPGLSSAEPDFEGAGYHLAEMLDREIKRFRAGKRRCRTPPLECYGPIRLVRRGSTASQTALSQSVRRALEFIRRRACDQTLRLDDVAAEMGCSRRSATFRFRKETGRSILNMIQDLRIERARDLLSGTTLPIETITIQCGYASASFLKRQFRKQTGMTMKAWRKDKGQRQ